MGSLQEQNRSLWVATTPVTAYPSLRGEVAVDVAVIGAGITGLSVATLLKRRGVRVAVIEAGHVASGVTGYTTAKVTSLHGLMYRKLLHDAGEAQTQQYAQANQAAVAQIARLVDELAIACDFRRAEALTYTEDPAKVGEIEAEVAAAQQVGLPASFTQITDLPYSMTGAINGLEWGLHVRGWFCVCRYGITKRDAPLVTARADRFHEENHREHAFPSYPRHDRRGHPDRGDRHRRPRRAGGDRHPKRLACSITDSLSDGIADRGGRGGHRRLRL